MGPNVRSRICSVVLKLLVVAISLAALGQARAEDYPSRPVRIIAPYPAGGTLDVVSRMIAQKLAESMGQAFIVENKSGAGGNVGADFVAKSRPDGYTLLMGNMSTHAINQSLYPNLSYDPVKDFAPITQTVTLRMALVVNPSVPARNVSELVTLAKSKPGQINYASGGVGTNQHLGAELFMHQTGTKMNHIPYKGNAPAIADLIGGQVSLIFDNLASVLPHTRSGKLRALAVTSDQRSPLLPDLPTVAETPGLAGFEVSGWHGLFAPAGTSPEIVHQLSKEVARILRTPEMQQQLSGQGVEPVGSTPEEFAAFQRRETEKWAQAVKISGAKVE